MSDSNEEITDDMRAACIQKLEEHCSGFPDGFAVEAEKLIFQHCRNNMRDYDNLLSSFESDLVKDRELYKNGEITAEQCIQKTADFPVFAKRQKKAPAVAMAKQAEDLALYHCRKCSALAATLEGFSLRSTKEIYHYYCDKCGLRYSGSPEARGN